MSSSQMETVTICFGFTLGFMVLTGSKAAQQTMSIYKKTRSLWSIYLVMIWMELIVCFAWAVSAWFFLRGDISASFGFYFYIVTLWAIQTQCLLQIIANRVSLVMTSRSAARNLKLGLFLAVGIVNISVYVIWIPARMQVSPLWMRVNEVWDRIEKVIYLFIDLGLNCYFLWLVRRNLISRGLTKYTPLYRFNSCIVVVSITMDILIIAMMSVPNDLVYTQFHSLAYIVKLNIELCMADLISKVVRKPDGGPTRTDTSPTIISTTLAAHLPRTFGDGTELLNPSSSNTTTTTPGKALPPVAEKKEKKKKRGVSYPLPAGALEPGALYQLSQSQSGPYPPHPSPRRAAYSADFEKATHFGISRSGSQQSHTRVEGGVRSQRASHDDGLSDASSDSGINFIVPENAIVKTVSLETRVEDEEEERGEMGMGLVRENSMVHRSEFDWRSTTSSEMPLNEYEGCYGGRG